LEELEMNSTEKQLVKGFLNENWKDFLKYIDEQLFETQMSDPFADEVSDIYNSIMDKLSEPSKPSA
jgi:hypothetical protein